MGIENQTGKRVHMCTHTHTHILLKRNAHISRYAWTQIQHMHKYNETGWAGRGLTERRRHSKKIEGEADSLHSTHFCREGGGEQ